MRRLVAFTALFVGLTLAGALWALWRAPVGFDDLRGAVMGQSRAALALLAALCAAIYGTDVLRYRALGAALGARVPWRAGLDASVANFFFSWILPGSTFGAPATVYMLGRRGVPWEAAIVIAFAKAFTGVAVVVAASLIFVLLGLGPRYDRGVVVVVAVGGSVFVALATALVVAASRPAPARRALEASLAAFARRFGARPILASIESVASGAIERLAQLLQAGGPRLAWLALTHALYFAAFAGTGLVLLGAVGGAVDLRSFAAIVLYIAFTYLAPTPGGAGFAEAMALPFFGPLLPADRAVLFVLSFRGLLLYLQVGFGVPYMLVVGGLGAIASRGGRGEEMPSA